MKRVITLLALCCSASIASAQPSFVVTVDAFDERLSPYGAWLELDGMGRVWQPAIEYVGDDFYPYGSGGQWVLTDEGWVFDSDYPFGWAVFHYGRWLDDAEYGWVWVPGRTWAPAWVSWRTGGTYVGWAPMGPRGVPVMRHDRWLFVETNQLTVRNVRSRAVDERRFHDAVTITRPMHGAVPVGPPAAYVSASTRERVRAVPMNQVHGGRAVPPPPPPGQVRPPPAQRRDAPFRSPPPDRDAPGRAPPPDRDAPGRAPPPPSPGASMDDRRPPPPRAEPPRVEPDRRNAPPPPRADPPPPRNEPDRRMLPPPAPREQPDRRFMPPPAPGHVDRNPGFSPQPGAYAPPRPPPPSAAPAPTKPKVQPGPPPPPGRRNR